LKKRGKSERVPAGLFKTGFEEKDSPWLPEGENLGKTPVEKRGAEKGREVSSPSDHEQGENCFKNRLTGLEAQTVPGHQGRTGGRGTIQVPTSG